MYSASEPREAAASGSSGLLPSRHRMASGSVFDRNRLLSSVRGFSRHPVLVLGDMVADEYIIGRPDRISREAPVLVLHHGEEFVCPGGAANVAYNLARLG